MLCHRVVINVVINVPEQSPTLKIDAQSTFSSVPSTLILLFVSKQTADVQFISTQPYGMMATKRKNYQLHLRTFCFSTPNITLRN